MHNVQNYDSYTKTEWFAANYLIWNKSQLRTILSFCINTDSSKEYILCLYSSVNKQQHTK
jgi:hypothetical protein